MTGPILVATDGTDAALGALHTAAALAARDGRPVVVVSVVEPVYLEGSVLYTLPGQAMAFADQPIPAVREVVQAQLRAVGGDAAGWTPEVLVGAPAAVVARAAEEHAAGLVVLGRTRHSRLDRLLHGETAPGVVRLARVPVLAVRADATTLPRRAVVAVDFSEFAADAAHTLQEVMGRDAELHLLHVAGRLSAMEPEAQQWTDTYVQGARARLEALARALRARGGGAVTTHVAQGAPAAETVALVRRVDADVLAMGSHGYGFFTRLLTGSVSTRLLREAPCSVLVAPPRDASPELRLARTGRAEAAPPTPAATASASAS